MSAEIIHFLIKTKPIGKARPRFTRFGHPYTPKNTADFETLVRYTARSTIGRRSPYPKDVGISLTLKFFFEVPKSWSKKKQAQQIGRPKLSKCDLDNLIKSVEDGFNRVIYEDDANVWEISASKRWAEENRIEVIVRAEKEGL